MVFVLFFAALYFWSNVWHKNSMVPLSVFSQMKWTTTFTFLTVFKYSVSYEKCPLMSFCPGPLYRWHAQWRAITFLPSETSCHRAVNEKKNLPSCNWLLEACMVAVGVLIFKKRGCQSLHSACSGPCLLLVRALPFWCYLYLFITCGYVSCFSIWIHHSTNHFWGLMAKEAEAFLKIYINKKHQQINVLLNK